MVIFKIFFFRYSSQHFSTPDACGFNVEDQIKLHFVYGLVVNSTLREKIEEIGQVKLDFKD
ncbi:SPK domain-containing protein [Caenorhabditis elegans]|uniref:SPK domain-containing protein n=1 Tax=Caenorhabditis elegans TaxID=6239 RepID=P91000_CAEEL|nr:SPK domain-containing protein [Caenorhabditis elegans]CCD62207.2 SPK domain-containing protein [Caenorhabditis elegans]|eukprot:NP_500840.2 Uncharacterized protein CELE_B0547.2 [Caenorhabditis elegans]